MAADIGRLSNADGMRERRRTQHRAGNRLRQAAFPLYILQRRYAPLYSLPRRL
jgi:hypothetical protein